MVSQSDTAPAGAPAFERKVYRSSTGRRTIFCFVFLILLPFFLSLPGMLYMRLKHGHVADSIELVVFALAFAALMFLLLIEVLLSVRARVELGPEKVRMTLPRGRGATPMLRYQTFEIPYDQVQAVETRREVYGGALMPVLLKGARLTLKDNSHVRLGYVSEANVDPAFPYPEIAAKIAERARLPVIDRGSVRRSFRNKMLGLKGGPRPGADTVDENQIVGLNRSHSNVMLALIGCLVVLMAVGLLNDVSKARPEARSPAVKTAVPAKAASASKPVAPAKAIEKGPEKAPSVANPADQPKTR